LAHTVRMVLSAYGNRPWNALQASTGKNHIGCFNGNVSACAVAIPTLAWANADASFMPSSDFTWSCLGSKPITACSAAKLTFVSNTPDSFFIPFSIFIAQLAQVILPIGNVIV
jgi:hypothetical protein